MTHEIFLDSGAYSVWNTGGSIDIDKYIDFILEHEDELETIVNLDVIPGKPKQDFISQAQIEEAVMRGVENYFYMLEQGVPKDKLMHVFHQGDSFAWLKKYLTMDMPLLGISPANDKTTGEKQKWLDRCMDYITDDKGFPLVKFHGLGVTSVPLMVRYPWYSVDSISWVYLAAQGKIFLPKFVNNKPDYTLSPLSLAVSHLAHTKNKKGAHVDSITASEKQLIDSLVEEWGFSYGKTEIHKEDITYKLKLHERRMGKRIRGETEMNVATIIEHGLGNDYRIRAELNAEYYMRVVQYADNEIFKGKTKLKKLFIL